jgi:hypothetical protein
MVLTPGALVIVAMAPFIVRLIPIVGAKRLIFIGFFFLEVAVWHLSHLTLQGVDPTESKQCLIYLSNFDKLLNYLAMDKDSTWSRLTWLRRQPESAGERRRG